MNGGQIILADEPTGALDSHSGAEVMALLRELADAGHTIILITHDRAVATQARRVIEISDGRIVGDSARGDSMVGRGCLAQPLAPRCPEAAGTPWPAELLEAARSAWRGMRLNRVRTSLTLLGIVIGVASVIVMLAIGEGARRKVVEQMGTMGTAILYMGSKPPATGGPAGQITEDDLAALRELPEIRRVMPVIGDPVTVRYGNADKQVYVFAASEEMPLVHHWRTALGRYYTEAEDRDLAPLVVLGHKAHRHFFPDTPDPLGRQLIIGTSAFEVIGVMSERGADSGAQDYDDMVFIPYRSGRARVYQAQTQPDYVVIEARSAQVVHEAEQAMLRLLLARHGGREDFGIGNAAARIQAEAATRESMAVMLGLIAAVSLVVGGIGVMNVMLMTVRERTREIGIRMAAASADVQAARAALWPRLTLTGSAAASAGRAADWLHAPVATLLAGLAGPIFDGGRLAAQHDAAQARREELLANYHKAIVAAFTDVELALDASASLEEQARAQDEALVQARAALALAESRYRSGAETMLALLDAQRVVTAAQDAQVQIRLARLQAAVSLYRALGGGWRPPEATSMAQAEPLP